MSRTITSTWAPAARSALARRRASEGAPPAGANRGRVHDDEVDRLLDEGEKTLDLTARKAIYAALEKRIRDQALLIPLWHEDQIAVVSDRARAFMPSAEGRWLGLAALR